MKYFDIRKMFFLMLLPLWFQATAQEFHLDLLSTYSTGIFDESAAEIAAYDASSEQLFFVNADNNNVEVLNISDPTNPVLVNELDLSAYGAGANSVAAYNGIVAIAVEADPATENGQIVFLDSQGNFLNSVEAGALPDMVVFSPDGTKVLSANEGEPDDDYVIDPEGSVTIVDISGGVASATAVTIGFEAFNDQKASLLNKGVRIFGNNGQQTVAQDLEPEYITFSADGSFAYVALQENNALAVVDVEGQEILDVLPLGLKNHLLGAPTLVESFLNELPNWPALGTPVYEGGEEVALGGFSGLYFSELESFGNNWVFYTIPDRGPNEGPVNRNLVGTSQNLRPFKLPNYQARIVRFVYNRASNSVTIDPSSQIFLTRKDGVTPISGRGNVPGFDEIPVTRTDDTFFPNVDYSANGVDYHQLPYDEFGGDFEGIVQAGNGDFWMCDEYRPAIYHFDSEGVLVERYVPAGTAQLGDEPQPAGTYGAETLPAVYSKRRANRGFEALALDSDEGVVYAFIQTPMYNPDNQTRNNSDIIRILGVDAATGEPVSEYVYLLERNKASGVGLSRVDKIGDAVYVGKGKFWVLERDSSTPDDGDCGKKYVYEIDINGATNILGSAISEKTTSTGADDKTLEMLSADELANFDITPVFKRKVLNLPSIGYHPSDKPEGLAKLPGNRMAVMNDNDFGLAGAGVSDASDLGIISFATNNGFDASNEDDFIEIWPRPTFGMYQPDAITSYEVDGKTYIVTANEGDARDYDGYSEEVRVDDLNLDPSVFPNANGLQDELSLGRLKTTTANGDIDGDGLVEMIHSYGARSFSIWDEFGNLIYDSGNLIEKQLSVLYPKQFNSNNDDNDSFKSRSDDKGPEPEAVEIAEFNGKTYVLVGLERMGGVMVFDISNPKAPRYIDYFLNRNFLVDAESTDAGDLGVEDIVYIEADDSPTGKPLVVTSNEVSGTVSIYGVADPGSRFSLQILHNNDGESQLINAGSGLENIGGVAQFKAVVDSLRYIAWVDGKPTILLSSGDNFIPGPEFSASLDLPANEPYYDAIAIKALRYDAICIGNHDFDFGPDVLEKFIQDSQNPQGWPRYMSANLDFSGEPGLQALADANRIVSRQILWRGTEKIGIVALTTPDLPFIASPGEVVVSQDIVNIAQAEVDALEADGVNKIILISHLQGISEDSLLATQLSGIDVMIAGGGDELLSNNPADTLPGLPISGPYPVVIENADNEPVYVVTTAGEYRYVGQLNVVFDENGKIIEVESNSGPIKVTARKANAFLQNAVINPVEDFIADLAANILATIQVDLDGIRNNVRSMETNEGNLVADAIRWKANELAGDFNVDPADVAIANGGGIRNNSIVPAGSNFTELLTFDILPFANFVTIVEDVPASQFKEILENCVSEVEFFDGRFGQVSGFSFVYNPNGTAQVIDLDGNITTQGSRILEVTLDDGTKIVENGMLVPGAPSIRIATVDFLARGGDQYPYGNTPFTILGSTYQQALADFIVDELGGIVSMADYPAGGEGRITEMPLLQIGTGNNGGNEAAFSGIANTYVYPNPFSNFFSVDYVLETAQDVTITVQSVEGKQIATLFEGVQEEGAQEFFFSSSDYNLAAGVYFLVIQTESGKEVIRIAKSK